MEREKETLLVVDDAPENIDMIKGVLGGDYKVKAVLNGETALQIGARKPPDLILLDIMMPGMDGYEVCRRLKEMDETKDIPIIFLTAKTDAEDIVKGLELGAVDYVGKPFNHAELKSRVNTHLSLRRATADIMEKNNQLNALASKLSKYLSPQVYDSIFTGEKDVKIETSHKPLTVFLSDIVGFTSIAEGLGHEELTQWLNTYLNAMAEICLDYGGTLDKFIGDAVMVFFGDPQSKGLEEDAKQCTLMAVDMLNKAAELGIKIRAGINTGDCTVGNFGSTSRMEYTIIGPTVNLVARLEHSSEPGRILISEATYELIKSSIYCEKHGSIQVKGIDRDIHTYFVDD